MNPHPPYPSPSPYPLPPPGHPQHPSQQSPHPQQQHHHDYQQTAAAALSAPPPPPPLQQHAQSSQHHVPTPNNTAAPNGRKRKAGQPGSRGVANLTPEQLAKKRANDREAQRAIRERTKNTIEGLEARIRELESSQPYQELQRALADRDRALQECEALRTRLAAVAGIVGNRDLGQTGLNGMTPPTNRDLEALLTPDGTELAALTAQQSPLPSTAATPSQYPHVQPSPAQKYEQTPQQHLHPDLRSPNNSSTTDSPSAAPSHYQSSEGQARKWTPESQGAHHHYPAHGHPYEQPRSAPAAQMQQPNEHNGERLGVNFLIEQQHSSPVPKPKASLSDDEPSKATRILLRSTRTCPLDHLVGSFVQERRAQFASGAPLSQVIGPDKPSLISMVHPEAEPKRGAVTDSLTPLLLNILSKFPDIDRDPERLAVLYGMYYLARWFVCPCKSCLEDCPVWARPLPEADENQHAVWIDYLPWPNMRRKLYLARTPGTRPHFEDWFVNFTRTLSVNWPYPPSSCLNITPSSTPGELPSIELSRAFIDHVTRLENWSIGPAFVSEFPELIDDTVRVAQRYRELPDDQQ